MRSHRSEDSSANRSDVIVVIDSSVGPIALSIDALDSAKNTAGTLFGDWSSDVASARNHPPLVNAAELATMFDVEASWFLLRAREVRIPHVRIGKYVRFDPVEIREFFHRNADRQANS